MDPNVLKQIIWTYCLPTICLFGIITNSISFYVFTKCRKVCLKNRIYQYLQMDSLVELFYLLICLIFFVLKLQIFSSIHNNYYVIIYEKYFFVHLASSLACYMIFLRIFISLRRLMRILNSSSTLGNSSFYKITISLFILSFIVHFPMVSHLTIVPLHNFNASNLNHTLLTSKRYRIIRHRYFELNLFGLISFLFGSIRGLIAPIVLLIINLMIIGKMKRAYKSKSPKNRGKS